MTIQKLNIYTVFVAVPLMLWSCAAWAQNPSVVNVVRSDGNPTSAASVDFDVTFSESVTGVDSTDFALSTTGTVAGTSVTGVSGSGTTYTVTVDTGTGDGTLRLDVSDDDSIEDVDTNPLGGAGAGNGDFTGGEVYTIDKSPPAVSSVSLASPNPTNAASVDFTVVFTESVTAVDSSDFNVASLGITGAAVTGVSGSGDTYTVTVGTGTGNGPLRLDVKDDDTIVDAALNPLGGAGLGNGAFISFDTYTIDKTGPSTTLASTASDPTNTSPIPITVSFSELVTGFDASDIAVVNGSVTNFSGSEKDYSFDVVPVAGGLVTVDVGADSAQDSAGNGNMVAGQLSRTYDPNPPTVQSVVRADTNPTMAASVDFTVTFSEDVTGVDTSDFTVDAVGVTGASIAGVSGSGTTYTVSVNTGAGEGTLSIDVLDDDTVVDDAGNNLASGYTTGEFYTIDRTGPTVQSVTRADSDPTNAAAVDFTVVFSENVTGVDVTDFTIDAVGVTGASVTGVSGTATTYTVSVDAGTGEGMLSIDVVDDDTVIDTAGNPQNGTFSAGQFYTVDRTAPAVQSVVRADANPTNASTVEFTVTFTEDVTGVDTSDFSIDAAGVTGTSVTGVSGTGAVYTVTADTGTGDGTLSIDVVDDGSIADLAGNLLDAGYTAGETYTVDRTLPTVTMASGAADPTNVSPIAISVTFSEAVTGFVMGDVVVGNGSVTGFSGSGDTYSIEITPSGDGLVTADIAAGVAQDAATNGNQLATQFSRTYDVTPPTVQSVVRADGDPTNAASVDFTVTFSEDVTGVDTSDFTIDAAGVTGASITGVSGSATTYTVSVNSGTGDGTLSIDVLDDDTIEDAAGNNLGSGYTTGETYTVDRTPPTVQSVVRADSDPTNAASVDFTVVFTEDVTGVDVTDFTIDAVSVTGASVTGVSGSGATYTVSVDTGAGEGTLSIDVADDDSIVDTAGNPLDGAYTAGQFYTVDLTPPSVQSLVRADANPTNAFTVDFTVTFNEDVTGVDASDFVVDSTGLSGGAITGLAGSGMIYTVTVFTGTGDGTLSIDVVDDGSIADLAGNLLDAGYTAGETYTVDRTLPTVMMASGAADPTNVSPIAISVTFSEAVTGFVMGDVVVGNGSVTGFSGSGDTYSIEITPSGDGLVTADIAAGVAQDAATNGNQLATQFSRTYDVTPPTVQSMVRADGDPTNAASVDFTVTFSEDVTGVDTSDFTIDAAGVTGASITGVSGSATTYTVSVNSGTGDGTLSIDVLDDDTIEDAAGNNLGSGYTTGETYTVDRTPPTVQSVVRADSDPTNAGSVDFTVVFTEDVTGVDVTDFTIDAVSVTGASVTGVSGSGATYTVSVDTGAGEGTLSIDVADDDSIVDTAGNPLDGAYMAGQFYTVDLTPPSVQSLVRADANPTGASTVDFTVTFTEVVTGVDASDFNIDAVGVSGASVIGVSGSGAVYTVTADTGTGDGTLSIDVFNNSTIIDFVGNSTTAPYNSGEAYTIDRTPPTVQSVLRGSSNPANATTLDFAVTFSEPVSGVDITDFTVDAIGVTGATVTGVTGSGATYTVSVDTGTGDGTLSIDVADDDSILDTVSVPLAGSFTSGEAYTIDKTSPTVLSVTRADANPTNATSVDFTVTFDEFVVGVDTADFSIDAVGVTGGSVTTVTGSGATYTVTVDTGTGDGTLSIDLSDDDSIADLAGNTLGGIGAANGDFTAGEAYTIDKTSPTVTITSAVSNPTNSSPISVSITFSDPVTGFDETDLTVVNATVSNFAGTGANYNLDLTPSADGVVTLDIAGGKAQDTAGNGNTAASQFSRTYDSTSPTVQFVTRADTNPTNATSVDFTIIFSEPVNGVTVSDFAVDALGVNGASVTNVAGAGMNYTVSVDTGTGDGTLSIDVVDFDNILDSVGNELGGLGIGNGGFTAGESYSIDKTAPTVAMSSGAPNPTNSTPIPVTVTFSEAANGFDATDIVPGNGTVTNFAGTGASYSFDLVPAGDGVVTASIGFGVAQDLAGNDNLASTQFSHTFDTAFPSIQSVVRADPDPTNSAAVDFTVTFTEPVTGVDVTDFLIDVVGVSGASITGTSGSGAIYTVTVNTGNGDGMLNIDVADDDSIFDQAGNPLGGTGVGNGVYASGEVYTIDKTSPTVSLTSINSDPTNMSPISLVITFSESVTGFDGSDITVGNATVGNFAGSGANYNCDLTPIGDGIVTAEIAGNVAQDAATNGNDASAQLSRTFDSTAPTAVSIALASPNPTSATTVLFTVTFSEDVTGVDVSDFAVDVVGPAGASVTGTSGSGSSYSLTVDTGTGDGSLSIDLVDDDTIVDTSGNALGGSGTGNGDFTTGQNYTIDRTSPTGVFSSTTADPTNVFPIPVSLEFSEPVTGLVPSDIIVVNGFVANLAGSGTSYTFDLLPSADGIVSAELPGAVVQDAAGNTNVPSAQFSRTYDGTAPRAVSIVRQGPNLTNAASVAFAVTFSEPVSGVDTLDFSLDVGGIIGASITNVSGGPSVYTVDVATGSGDGSLSIDVLDDGSILDVGSSSLEAPFSIGESYTIDKTSPTLLLSTTATDPTNTSPIPVQVSFSEAVYGFDVNDIVITNAFVSNFSGSFASYSFDIFPTASGTITLDVAAGSAQDAAGNGNLAPAQWTQVFDSAGPLVTISDPTPLVVAVGSSSYVVTYENAFGITLAESDITLMATGSAMGTVTVSGTGTEERIVTISGISGQGTLSITIASGTAADDLGNLAFAAGPSVPITVDPTLDSDSDGILDVVEGDDDADSDGLPNYLDSDSDGDGIDDIVEGTGDPDGDGLPNFLDEDSDGDGIDDILEGTDDPDGDGLPNYLDNDSDGDGIDDIIEGAADPDGDSLPNFLDDDSDGDGISDGEGGSGDADGDGLPNYLDSDADGDGIDNVIEGNADTDGDGIPNYLDDDSDGDGIQDVIEGVGDPDDDGLPNYLDNDSDGDGIDDAIEGDGDLDGDGIPNFLDGDSDGDGIDDIVEGAEDPDGDGLPNFLDDDSDGDGVTDDETGSGDSDGDGLPNYLDADADGDGIDNIVEGNGDPDGDGLPNFLDGDSDGDGIEDMVEGVGDPDGDGVSNYLDDDSDGDSIADIVEGSEDPDGDSIPNFLDNDSDGDGIEDVVEGVGDPDGDSVPNFLDADSDNDGTPDSWEIDNNLNPLEADGTNDEDGDGFTNWEEFVGNSDPRDADSLPELTILDITPKAFLTLGGSPIHITGVRFDENSRILVNGVECASIEYDSSTHVLSAIAPAGFSGPASITVENPATSTSIVDTGTCRYTSAPFDEDLDKRKNVMRMWEKDEVVVLHGYLPDSGTLRFATDTGVIIDFPATLSDGYVDGFVKARIAKSIYRIFQFSAPTLPTDQAPVSSYLQVSGLVWDGSQSFELVGPTSASVSITMPQKNSDGEDDLSLGFVGTALDQALMPFLLPDSENDSNIYKLETVLDTDSNPGSVVFDINEFGTYVPMKIRHKADVNRNGSVDATDVQLLTNLLLGHETSSIVDENSDGIVDTFEILAILDRADIDDDGLINASDLQHCINAVLRLW